MCDGGGPDQLQESIVKDHKLFHSLRKLDFQ